MLIIKDVQTITVPVDILVPGDEAPSRVQATWKLYDYTPAQDRLAAIRAGEITDEQLLTEDLLDLAPLKDAAGNSLKYTPELGLQLLEKTYIRMPLIQSWFPAQAGRAEAAAKN
ncbi:hypothetical protein [Zobellella sp. DQSA1]|uniref:hypothetical protein n=1 Tax=Zobellella sp. DQSA1 TaxID=3342386 RepID=UPI0035BFBE99